MLMDPMKTMVCNDIAASARLNAAQFVSPSLGGMNGRTGSVQNFAAAYRKIANANKRASSGAHAETPAKSLPRWKRAADGNSGLAGSLHETGLTGDAHAADGSTTVPDAPTGADATVINGANDLIRQALQATSQALHLTLDPGLAQLSINTASGSASGQISDILMTLKGITGILEEAASKGETLDTGSAVFDVSASRNLAGLLNSQIFKIELGASMLGIGEQVSADLAQKMDGTFSGNIPQAIDPSILSMTPTQLQSLLAGSNASPADMQLLAEKIAALCGQPLQADLDNSGTGDSSTGSGSDAGSQAAIAALFSPPGADAVQDAPATTVPAYTTLDESVMRQVADKLQSAARQGISEIRIQIQPESLGEVRMRIQVDGNVVSAHLQVANQQVQKLIEGNMQSLRDALSMQHLEIGSIDVNVSGDGGQGASAGADGAPAPVELDEAGLAGNAESADSALQPSGTETGRRFGSNTIEFFA